MAKNNSKEKFNKESENQVREEQVRESRTNNRSTSHRNNGDKSARSNKQSRRYSESRNDGKTSFKGDNDPSWYGLNPQILKDAASLSFNNPLGAPIQENSYRYTGSEVLLETQYDNSPGIMAFTTVLMPGISNAALSNLNLVAQAIYSFVRHANSGSKNYDPADLLNYIMAMDEIYALWYWGVRCYGVSRAYSQVNRYVPEDVIRAMGFNYEDVMKNLANFRSVLNVIAARIAEMAVPQVFSLFKRHAWLYLNIYQDASDFKSQLYLLTPAGYRTFEEKSEGKPGHLKFHAMKYMADKDAGYTVDEYYSLMMDAIGKVIRSEDMGTMSGDIKKAYGDAGLWSITSISEDFTITPIYSEEVLTQFHNIQMLNALDATPERCNFDITQDAANGVFISEPKWPAKESAYNNMDLMYNRLLLSAPMSSPTPEDVMVMTRLHPTIGPIEGTYAEGTPMIYVKSCGSELIYDARMYVKQTVKSGDSVSTDTVVYVLNSFNTGLLSSAASYYACFDWAPRMYFKPMNGDNTPIEIWERRNVTNPGVNALSKLDNAAIMSEFSMPYNLNGK